MLTPDIVFAWVAIGAAASLAGMIWPFQRGAWGVVLNFAVGIGGAAAGGVFGVVVSHGAVGTPASLALAAAGALAALGVVHALWARHTNEARRASDRRRGA